MKPKENWYGKDTLSLSVSDKELTNTANLYCTINPVNDLPCFENLMDTLNNYGKDTSSINLWDYVIDIEDSPEQLSYIVTTSSDTLKTMFNVENGELKLHTNLPYEGNIKVSIKMTDTEGGTADTDIVYKSRILTGLHALDGLIPDQFILEQNYPNPFNPVTTIRYGLPKESNVKIIVYNLLGEVVVSLLDDVRKAGYYEEKFHASNLSSGIYLFRVIANSVNNNDVFMKTKKMLLLK
ncbi:MAG: T9SS type A sorting domain-containing protein [Melioribacteraceae bacterium]|nr:T9SS type A sorting domain-containing protein [Melioribacteraceae bacterium]